MALPMIVVNHSDFKVLLVICDGSGIRVPGTLWVGHHVTYGQPFRDIHSQVMRSRQSGNKL